MRRWLGLLFLLVTVAAASVTPGTAARLRPAVQTKARAEVDVLGAVARNWKRWQKYGLVDRRTHLLSNNTEAVCRGHGKRRSANRYHRFVCVVRPQVHQGRQGVWVNYRAFAKHHFKVRFLAYRRH